MLAHNKIRRLFIMPADVVQRALRECCLGKGQILKLQMIESGGQYMLLLLGGNLNVIVMLLEHGDSGKATRDGQSIQGCAAERDHHGLVEMFRKVRYYWLASEGDYRVSRAERGKRIIVNLYPAYTLLLTN